MTISYHIAIRLKVIKAIQLLVFTVFIAPEIALAQDYNLLICKDYIDQSKLDHNRFIAESEYNKQNAQKSLLFLESGVTDTLNSIEEASESFSKLDFDIEHWKASMIVRGYFLKSEYELTEWRWLKAKQSGSPELATEEQKMTQARQKFCDHLQQQGRNDD